MTVRDQDARQPAALEMFGDGPHMVGMTDAGVDERGLGAVQEPGVGPRTRHRTGVTGEQAYGRDVHREGDSFPQVETRPLRKARSRPLVLQKNLLREWTL